MTAASRRLADAIQRAAERAVTQRAPGWLLATVTAVHGDGTCDIATATGPVANVRRLKSYTSPTVDDVVQVDRNAVGNWLITGVLATS